MRVLLVEDDVLVRMFAAEGLADEGFLVMEAATADEALQRFMAEQPDVLVTDIQLPGRLSGWDIAERCRATNPRIPVIYVTGFSHETARPVAGSVRFQKPYSAADLATTIRLLVS
jgi:CheY-like chemotaxis protein